MKLPDDWKYIKLSDITTPLTEMAGDKKYETLSISAGIGFVNQAKKFGKELSGKQYEKYTVLQRGDFSYNKGNSKKYPQGCIYQLTDRDCAAVPNVFESFRFILGINDYYEQLFMSGFLNHQLASRINHGVRDDGLLNLTGKDFYDCFVPSPPLAEQKKIAEILYKQDKLILFKQKLLEQKQQQKKWLMQKLLEVSYAGADVEEKFSLGGVVIDKRRWKKEILGNVTTYSCVRKKDLESSYICTENMKPDFGGISFYKTSEFIDGVCYEKGDILLGNIRPYLRKAWMADRDGVCSPDVLVLKMTDKVFSDFLYNVIANEKFLKYVMKGVKGTKMPRGDKEHVMKYVFYLPTLPEQKIIAKVLSAADKEIALLKSSIEQEKQKKKSLAQLLLTGTVRVKI